MPKKMSEKQLQQLLDYTERQTNLALDRILKEGSYKNLIDQAYQRIGESVMSNYKASFEKSWNSLTTGRELAKQIKSNGEVK